MGTICVFDEAVEFLKDPLFVEGEFFLCSTGDMTPVMNAAFFGRPRVAEIIEELAEEEKYTEDVYKMLL